MNKNDVKQQFVDSGGITNWRVNFMKSQSIMWDIAFELGQQLQQQNRVSAIKVLGR